MTESVHKAVLLEETIENLNLTSGKNIIDCTFGAGGHSREIYQRIKPTGKLVVIDADETTFEREAEFVRNKNIITINDNFRNLQKIIKDNNIDWQVDGILADFGFSSDQIENSGRGFSFLRGSEPLDMRFDIHKQTATASEILNNYNKDDLEYIFQEYGEYDKAWQLADKVVKYRKEKELANVFDLVELVLEVDTRRGKTHPATQVFQALRIEVNQEFRVIKEFLPQAIEALRPGGRLAVITFHSIEDRIVKKYFQEEAHEEEPKIRLINKKAIKPSYQETERNRRSRSAILRVVEKK